MDSNKTREQLILELEELRFRLSSRKSELLDPESEKVRTRLAAERLRAEAIGMQYTEDLARVAGLMFRELRDIGLSTDTCWVDFFEPDHDKVQAYQAFVNPRVADVQWNSPDLTEQGKTIVVASRDHSLENI